MARKKLHDRSPGGERLRLAAMGLEAEFALFVDERPVRPEKLFGSPRGFVRAPLMHRVGTSYHLPTGGAIYFDTGVIEIATPVIEIARGCAARAGRSLWEGIGFTRDELDAWERRTGRSVRLAGFSAHYNISFTGDGTNGRTVEALALLLSYLLPPAVMLLATNPRSTGVGVRPRGERIEVTVDFTPSPALMIATATVIAAVARTVMHWPSFELAELAERGLPVIDGFHPVPHTSRQGWLARWDCYPASPFRTDPDAPVWRTTAGEQLSLRELAARTLDHFGTALRNLADPFTRRLLQSILHGDSPVLLELPDRPPAYEDVGRLCRWDDLFPTTSLDRSSYERALIHAIAGDRLRVGRNWYRPVAMQGWSRVVFRREEDGTRHLFSIDDLAGRRAGWQPVGRHHMTTDGGSARRHG
ncbi:MAG: hypothetical protein WEA24_03890 [Gemmatimonadota bacterium]